MAPWWVLTTFAIIGIVVIIWILIMAWFSYRKVDDPSKKKSNEFDEGEDEKWI